MKKTTKEQIKEETEVLLTPQEVANIFAVDPRTVIKWSKSGKLPVAGRTVGGHRRFSREVVYKLLNQNTTNEGQQ